MFDAIETRISAFHHDDALGRWQVLSCRPAADLADVVELLWLGEGQVNYQRDRILPSGGSQLLINLGPPQYVVEGEEPVLRRQFKDIWCAAARHGPIDTESPHGQALLGIAFKPIAARSWLGVPAHELTDQALAAEQLFGSAALRLRETLLNTSQPVARFGIAEDWLRRRLRRRAPPPPALAWALQQLQRSRGLIPIEQLAASLGYSRKYLSSLFRSHVGLSAKALARLYRFNDALALLRGQQHVPWVQLAETCGYYDQSHLIRDFRAFSGFAPGEFLRRAQPDAGSIVIS